MFFRKKNPYAGWSQADRKREELEIEVFSQRNVILSRVKDVLSRQGVVYLYPNGSHKYEATLALQEAQRALASQVEKTDEALNNARRYIEEHEDEFVATADWGQWSDDYSAHVMVEDAYCSLRGYAFM